MERRPLGESDLSPSVFGLGTMTFGVEANEETSNALLYRYVEAGGGFLDTADVYARGRSEEIIGRWLARRGGAGDLVIATKGRFATSDDPADRGAGRAHLTRAVEASLRRLGVDVIDLYQIHAWDPVAPIEETLEALDDLVRAGKIRWIGVSNFLGWQLERALLTSRHRSWAPVVSLQPQYNLLTRDIELDVLPVCLEGNVGILPWSPLGGGWLTGKYSAYVRPAGATRLGVEPNRGVEAYDLRNNDHTWGVVEAVRAVAGERGVTMSQVALNWLRQRPGITSVLLGCRNVGQLEDNLGALEWELTPEEMGRLNEISAPGIPTYPHGFLEVEADVDVWERLATRVGRPY